MNKEHELFGGDFEILLMSIIYKMPIIIFQNDSKGLLMVTNTESLYFTYGSGDPPARVHPTCHLYLLSYYCPMNPSYQNEFNHYMYLAVQERKSANPYIGHVMSAEWDLYFYEKKLISDVQPKEKDVEKVRAASEEDLLVEVPKAATDKELKEEVVDINKEFGAVKVGAAFEEGKSIKSIVEKDTKISMDDAQTI